MIYRKSDLSTLPAAPGQSTLVRRPLGSMAGGCESVGARAKGARAETPAGRRSRTTPWRAFFSMTRGMARRA